MIAVHRGCGAVAMLPVRSTSDGTSWVGAASPLRGEGALVDGDLSGGCVAVC